MSKNDHLVRITNLIGFVRITILFIAIEPIEYGEENIAPNSNLPQRIYSDDKIEKGIKEN